MSSRRVFRRAFGVSTPEAARPRTRRVAATLLAALALAVTVASMRPGNAGVNDAHTPLARIAAARPAARSLVVLAGTGGSLPAAAAAGGGWTLAARVGGRPAAWLARRAGVTLMRFDQALVHLVLHAGSSDGGSIGWIHGDHVAGEEVHRLIAAINGGFKLNYPHVGFMSGGHVAVRIKPGLASLVTYSDGTTNIGAWRAGVPSERKTVFSVLQNQRLLVDRGIAAATVSDCVLECWGGTVGLVTVVARSGLGITANGQLVWAAGEHLSPSSSPRP